MSVSTKIDLEIWSDFHVINEKDKPSRKRELEAARRFMEMLRPMNQAQMIQNQLLGLSQFSCTCHCPVHGNRWGNALIGGIFGGGLA